MITRIKALRRERGLTQEELAEMVDTSGSHISSIENNKREPSTTMLALIAKALKVDVAELVGQRSAPVSEVVSLLETLPEKDQATALAMVRAFVQSTRE